jgi:DNA modification methylase
VSPRRPRKGTARGPSTTTITYYRGDVRDVQASLRDNSVHMVCDSPPFLALRSYLPPEHPDKDREIGSEATPAAFIDTMLGLSADWRRLLPRWGSIAIEIGDTYSGSGGAGGDYNESGLRQAQPRFSGSGSRARTDSAKPGTASRLAAGAGWPLAKSLCLIPELYAVALAYGINPLTGGPSPAGEWRVRNWMTWTRPNPPVGGLGDKFRPATSFVTVATVGDKKAQRWFDLDAVRGPGSPNTHARTASGIDRRPSTGKAADDSRRGGNFSTLDTLHDTNGAPPLDWWDANDLTDDELGEHWQALHRLPTSPYKGSHYATFPVALPQRLIEAMCPREVCTVCGEPRRRITATTYQPHGSRRDEAKSVRGFGVQNGEHAQAFEHGRATKVVDTIGWTDCGHNAYAPGVVLDPFGGSGTTAIAAARSGRDAVLIDLDERNVDLARQRITESLRVIGEVTTGDTTVWTVDLPLPAQIAPVKGQASMFEIPEFTAQEEAS